MLKANPETLVSSDPRRAQEAVTAGASVVLIGADPEQLASEMATLRAHRGPEVVRADGKMMGRVAGFVGDPDDPGVRQAAQLMADELFGSTRSPVSDAD